MEEKRIYRKQKREIIDKCNICGQVTNLTWDHVPPKFCFNNQIIKFNSIIELNQKDVESQVSQNGVKYRSICSMCNNSLLGRNYDVEFKKLVDILYNIYITPGEIGQYIEIQGLKINKIARAIVGHFLAARNEYFDGKGENELRNYFLNPSLKPPSEFKLLYYTYIYNTIMIIRDVVPKKLENLEYAVPEGLISCINSFPIAFILAHNCDNPVDLYDLFELCTEDIEETVNIKIDLLSYMYPNKIISRDPYWPCNVSDDETGTSIILASDSSNSSVFSQVRDLKRK